MKIVFLLAVSEVPETDDEEGESLVMCEIGKQYISTADHYEQGNWVVVKVPFVSKTSRGRVCKQSKAYIGQVTAAWTYLNI